MGVEEFVVLQREGEFVRPARADFDSPTAFVPGIFHVINEPQLFVRANFSGRAYFFFDFFLFFLGDFFFLVLSLGASSNFY